MDRLLYRLLFRVWRRLLPTCVGPTRLSAAQVRRLLVARADGVGDLIVFLPALAYLRAALPHAEIDVVATAPNVALLRADPRISRVITWRAGWLAWLRTARRLRARRYDAVLSVRLRSHLEEGLFAALVAGRRGARITAWRPKRYAGLFTHSVRVSRGRRHMVERLLRVVTAIVEPPPTGHDSTVRLFAPDAAERRAEGFVAGRLAGRPFVALNVWTTDARRSLTRAQGVRIAAGIVDGHPGLAVLLTPPPRAAAEAREMAAEANALVRQTMAGAAREPSVLVAEPSAEVADLVSLLARADAVISPDTANVHIASALGRPLLAVYSSHASTVDVWGAWGTMRRVLLFEDRRPMASIDVDVVLEAFDELWDRVAEHASGRAARQDGAWRPGAPDRP